MCEWLQTAENLPLGQTARSDCPACGVGTRTNAAIINHNPKYYSIYCNACDHREWHSKGIQTLAELKRIEELNRQATTALRDIELPADFTTDIPRTGRLWLYKAGITETVWKANGIGYSESLDRVVLPVYDDQDKLIWFQCRAVHEGQKPKYIQPSRDKGGALFHRHTCGGSGEDAVIVEDILSAIRVGKHTACYCIMGTKASAGQINVLQTHRRVLTWLDPDRAGRRGAYSIRKSLGLMCEVGNIETQTDPKFLSDVDIQRTLRGEGVSISHAE